MTNVKAPKSQWVIKRNYFKVELHSDFKNLWALWLTEIELGDFDDEAELFADTVTAQGEVFIYQFPSRAQESDELADYFEKIDNNYVIPRHLFTIIK